MNKKAQLVVGSTAVAVGVVAIWSIWLAVTPTRSRAPSPLAHVAAPRAETEGVSMSRAEAMAQSVRAPVRELARERGLSELASESIASSCTDALPVLCGYRLKPYLESAQARGGKIRGDLISNRVRSFARGGLRNLDTETRSRWSTMTDVERYAIVISTKASSLPQIAEVEPQAATVQLDALQEELPEGYAFYTVASVAHDWTGKTPERTARLRLPVKLTDGRSGFLDAVFAPMSPDDSSWIICSASLLIEGPGRVGLPGL